MKKLLMQLQFDNCYVCGSRFNTTNVAFYEDPDNGLPVCTFCAPSVEARHFGTDAAADFAVDAAREDRIFGRGGRD